MNVTPAARFIGYVAESAEKFIAPSQPRLIAQAILNAAHRCRRNGGPVAGRLWEAARTHAEVVSRSDGLGPLCVQDDNRPDSSFAVAWVDNIARLVEDATDDALICLAEAATVTGGYLAEAMLKDLARLKLEIGRITIHPGPLNSTCYQFNDLREVFRTGWAKHQGPSDAELLTMSNKDMIFGGFDTTGSSPRLIAVVHTRIVPKDTPLRASALFSAPAPSAVARWKVPTTQSQSIVAHAAVTHESYKGANITRKIITETALPYLERHYSDLPILTFSPATYIVSAGKALIKSPDFKELVRLVEEGVSRVSAHPLSAWIKSASRHLFRAHFEVKPHGSAPAVFFHDVFTDLDEHKDLVDLHDTAMEEGDNGPARAILDQKRKRVFRLFATKHDSSPQEQADRDAAVLMIKLAFAMTQAGVHRNGQSPDEVAAFHLGNGAVHSPHGVIVGARTYDHAALTMGAVFEYHKCWRENQRRHRARIAERQAKFAPNTTHVDMELARAHLSEVMARMFAA